MYGKVVNGKIVYAPYNYKLSDGTLIIGFNTNEELMMRYGYKEIVEHEVDYDPNTEELYISNIKETINLIEVYYSSRNKNTFVNVDLSNVYTRDETYDRATIDGFINHLQIDKADISDLNAINAKITNLEAGRVDTEYLDANYATIEQLNATNANVSNLQADKANITDLHATNAEIENLKVDKADIAALTATNAKITNLEADKADISFLEANYATINQLDATNANITNLQADTANINNAIINKADIIDLNATNANIANLQAIKANITDLDAAKADINVLNSNVADIDTLINGNLTSDNIQSMIITGDKFTVADAFIKDAMIANVSASKINTGIINTNNVRIQSDDGSMIINGTTQQFKDKDNKVRIQIGKDAQGNFTFALFSQDGVGILIDETGIKSGAVPDGLIVNDMVSEGANISGSKLDINSVISSINNGTEVIKGTRIQLDEQGQSLQVAFNQLKSKVETIEQVSIDGDLSSVINQVTSNTTNITTMQGQISSLISNTTITKANGEVVQLKDEYNATVDTVNSHKQTIGLLETNLNKVSTGQNKWLLEMFEKGEGVDEISPITIKEIMGEALIKALLVADSATNNQASYGDNYLGRATTYVYLDYDYDWETTATSDDGSTIYLNGNIVATLTSCDPNVVTLPFKQGWNKITWVYNEGTGGDGWDFNPRLTTIPQVKYMNAYPMTNVDEVGNILDGNIKTVSSKQATLEQNLDGFKQTVSETYATKTSLNTVDDKFADYSTTSAMNSAINQKANEITSSVSETYATKTALNTVDGKFANYSTTSAMNSAINQKGDSILSTVSNTYTTKADFNNLSIGGRNYYTKTSNMFILTGEGTITRDNSINGFVLTADGNGDVLCRIVCIWEGYKYYTVSGYFKADTQCNAHMDVCDYDMGNKSISTTYTKFSGTAYVDRATDDIYNFVDIECSGVGAGNKVYIKDFKVEEGQKATSWTPAPEDVDNSIATVDGKFANYSTTSDMNTAIQQKANEITSTVSQTYTTKAEFNSLEIGGTNLVLNSSFAKNAESWTINAVTWDDIAIIDESTSPTGKAIKITVNTTVGGRGIWQHVTPRKTGNYTLSFYAKADTDNYNIYAGQEGSVCKDFVLTTNWTKYTHIYNKDNLNTNAIVFYTKDNASNSVFYIHSVKLEYGNKATEWSPAPEDINANITAVDNKFVNYSTTQQMNTAINQKAESITQSVSNTYATKTSLKSANDNITSLTNRMQSAESKLTKDSLTTTIGNYYTTSTDVNGIITSKNYATTSQLQQTATDLTATFNDGYNQGITRINKDGIKVLHNSIDSNSYTHMSSSGFYLKNKGTDIFKVDSNGLYLKGNVTITGGSVPSTTLTGTIDNGRLNSAIVTGANNGTSAKSTLDSKASGWDSTKSTVDGNASKWNNTSARVEGASTAWDNAYNRVVDWAYGSVGGTTTINGGLIQTGTITAKHVYLGDLTNYCNLIDQTASLYGFTAEPDNWGTWFRLNNNQRDTCISGNGIDGYSCYKCNGGESFRIKYQMKSNVKSGDTYCKVSIGCYGMLGDGNPFWTLCDGGMSDADSTERYINATIKIPDNARTFGVYLQLDNSSEWSGTCRIKNVQVIKMSSGELIVDGAITADKIAANAITANQLAADAITGKNITGGTINIGNGVFIVDANGQIKAKTIPNSKGQYLDMSSSTYKIYKNSDTLAMEIGFRDLVFEGGNVNYSAPCIFMGSDGINALGSEEWDAHSGRYYSRYYVTDNNGPTGDGHNGQPTMHFEFNTQYTDTDTGYAIPSKFKFYADGHMRISPVRDLEIYSYSNNGEVDSKGNEYLLAKFYSSNSNLYSSALDIPAVINTRRDDGILIADRSHAADGVSYDDNTDIMAALNIVAWHGENGNDYRYVRPYLDGSHNLGSADRRWGKIYSSYGTVDTSDRRCKTNINYLSPSNTKAPNKCIVSKEDIWNFIKDIDYASYNFIDSETGNTEVDNQFGFILQDLIQSNPDISNNLLLDSSCKNDSDAKDSPLMGYNKGNYINILGCALQQALVRIEELENKIKEGL